MNRKSLLLRWDVWYYRSFNVEPENCYLILWWWGSQLIIRYIYSKKHAKILLKSEWNQCLLVIFCMVNSVVNCCWLTTFVANFLLFCTCARFSKRTRIQEISFWRKYDELFLLTFVQKNYVFVISTKSQIFAVCSK